MKHNSKQFLALFMAASMAVAPVSGVYAEDQNAAVENAVNANVQEVHHALLPRYGSKAVKQKAHKCNTLLYHRIGFGKRKRLLPSDGCKDAFGKSLAIS